MKKNIGAAWVVGMLVISQNLHSQEESNTAERLLQQENRFTLGGYGQIDYNQPVNREIFSNGTLDVHRLVFLLGYRFSDKVQFVSEVELEHVKEVYVEQAFLQAEITPWLKFRGGLMLIPMGIINEFHEPPTFNGVERPNLDKYIVPTTWREIGAGFTGTFPTPGISYTAYLVNGFSSYNSDATLDGPNGLRSGRQKGVESYIGAPNLALKVNYFGISGLQIGFSFYGGETQSSLRDGIDKSDPASRIRADSTIVGLLMVGADARYTRSGFKFRVQANYGWINGAEAYNLYTSSDLGSGLGGWYAEVAYDVFHTLGGVHSELIPFIRYERYNTHASVPANTISDPSLNRTDVTMGLGWKLHEGAMIKIDYQIFSDHEEAESRHQFNGGIALWF